MASSDFPIIEHAQEGSNAPQRWLKRRILFAVPLALMAVLQLLFTLYTRDPYAIYLIPFVAGGLIAIFAGVVVYDSRTKSKAPAGVLWISSGRFPIDQLRLSPARAMLSSAGERWRGSRGWVDGTLSATREGLDFAPGRTAKRAGAESFHTPWRAIKRVVFVPQRISLATGLEFYWADGSELDCEVRNGNGFIRLLSVLREEARAEQPSPPDPKFSG